LVKNWCPAAVWDYPRRVFFLTAKEVIMVRLAELKKQEVLFKKCVLKIRDIIQHNYDRNDADCNDVENYGRLVHHVDKWLVEGDTLRLMREFENGLPELWNNYFYVHAEQTDFTWSEFNAFDHKKGVPVPIVMEMVVDENSCLFIPFLYKKILEMYKYKNKECPDGNEQ